MEHEEAAPVPETPEQAKREYRRFFELAIERHYYGELPDSLKDVDEQVRSGREVRTTVRTLLSWFGASRRRPGLGAVNNRIHFHLDRLNLETVPDFGSPDIDEVILFRRKSPPGSNSQTPADILQYPATNTTNETVPAETDSAVPAEIAPVVRRSEPAHRIGRLRSANTLPTWVNPNSTVKVAFTFMVTNDFSQLPVMQNERQPKGIFSWKSYGSRLALGETCSTVGECMNEHKELRLEDSVYDAIPLIVRYECVLIRNSFGKICGIVTPADLSLQFQELAERFVLLDAIENQIREWIAPFFGKEDLEAIKEPEDKGRPIDDVSDLTFGEYIRLLEKPTNWEKLRTPIDRGAFIQKLDKIRLIRNDVMHFDPDPLEPSDLDALRNFAQFLESLNRTTFR